MNAWPDLFFKDPELATQKFLTFRNELDNQSLFQSAPYHNASQITIAVTVHMRHTSIDQRYFDTFGMNLILGRNFSPDIESDKEANIINETAFKRLGLDRFDRSSIERRG